MREIKARDGYYLTQATEVEDRLYLTAIKGVNINENDWREATEDEKIAFEKSKEEKMKLEIISNDEHDFSDK
jgi:hypothetical protein